METKKNILFGVLNWGLGHATRSVPIIHKLIELGYAPVLASDGDALHYLKKEFPQLVCEEIASYSVQYKFQNIFLQSLYLAPKISLAIRKEQKQLKELIKTYEPLAVISDNRLGFYSDEIPCAYISHQNTIIAPFPFSLANKIHHYFINKFNEFWIPDLKNNPGISGKLGHSKDKGSLKFIGPLSRFSNIDLEEKTQVYDLVAILSGPEPQRSKLEEKICKQLKNLPGKFLIIRGKEDGREEEESKNIQIRNLVFGKDLASLIQESKMVLSRSGYSSIMDYYFLQNKALLIPTPGQSEQVYLAQKLKDEEIFYSVDQKELDLAKDLEMVERFSGFTNRPSSTDVLLEAALLGLFKGK